MIIFIIWKFQTFLIYSGFSWIWISSQGKEDLTELTLGVMNKQVLMNM